MSFHNPYNFIPAADRKPGGLLDDAPPIGHQRLHPDCWTGHLAVTLTTVSPLLIPDAGEKVDGSEHYKYGTRIETDADGTRRVYLPPTSIKGMLRSAYEAVTNSRMGVFGSRDPLAYRADSSSALKTRPVLIELFPDGQPRSAIACPWLSYKSEEGKVTIRVISLPGYGKQAVRYADNSLPVHGDRVGAWIELIKHPGSGGRRDYWYWRVFNIWPQAETAPSRPAELGVRTSDRHQATGIGARVEGQVHRTNQNIKGKHDERLFITDCLDVDTDADVRVESQVTLELGDAWERYLLLIGNYRDAHTTDRHDSIWERSEEKNPHKKERPWDVIVEKSGKEKSGKIKEFAWSRHLYDITDSKASKGHALKRPEIASQGQDMLAPGQRISCYAFLNGNKVKELVPVMISRRWYPEAPWALLPKGVDPAERLDRLSPADRVFGWVRQPRPGEDKRSGDGRDQAMRGALRIGPVCGPPANPVRDPLANLPLATDALEYLDLPLEILGAPKPSQARFYVGICGEDGLAEPLAPGTKKEESFVKGRVLRGRKVYPHQPKCDAYWDPVATSRGARRPKGADKSDRDKQNRTITSWVRPNQKFRFTIHVRNLSDCELGALLLLLDPHLFGTPERPGLHRLGHGKPLGFGSVCVKLDNDGHDLRRGDDWAADFGTLGQAQPTATWTGLAGQFVNAMTGANAKILEKVRAAAAGFNCDATVHYPRLKPQHDANTLSYEWFVANAKLTGKYRDATLGEFNTPLDYM